MECSHSFCLARWIHCADSNEWYGVINGTLWRLRQLDDSHPVEFQQPVGCNQSRGSQYPPDLTDYFRLDVSLTKLLKQWRKNDPQFAHPVHHSTVRPDRMTCGIRLLRQDPIETVFSFMTSANNNVARITQLLMRLSQTYGQPIRLSGSSGFQHWKFPSLSTLAGRGMEEKLRVMGFGYRSKFIPAAARWIQSHGGENRLLGLRKASTDEAREFLLNIPGIGNKVSGIRGLS
ncbi:unnamed protein product [Echinostoma caproni]|uniref:DNA-(apurinic or apyrimidinic site) lyase n=1 Tax=Echinostoma caproni TaxID=27848 RepID=A0A183BCS3_9TREM|nr:unnamed protein product [Echinostoma caproni]